MQIPSVSSWDYVIHIQLTGICSVHNVPTIFPTIYILIYPMGIIWEEGVMNVNANAKAVVTTQLGLWVEENKLCTWTHTDEEKKKVMRSFLCPDKTAWVLVGVLIFKGIRIEKIFNIWMSIHCSCGCITLYIWFADRLSKKYKLILDLSRKINFLSPVWTWPERLKSWLRDITPRAIWVCYSRNLIKQI